MRAGQKRSSRSTGAESSLRFVAELWVTQLGAVPYRDGVTLQETLHAMGCALLDDQPGIAEIKFSAPNKHHFLVDFSGFDVDGPPFNGLSNDGEVFIAADRPYGLIEAQVSRDDSPPAGDAWLHVPGFC